MATSIPASLNPQRTLKARLSLAFGLIAVFLSILLSLVVDRTTQRHLSDEGGATLALLARQLADKLDRQMFERYKDVQTLSSFPTFRNPWTPPEVQRALMERLQQTYPAYAWIGLTDENGFVRASTGGLLEGQDVSRRDWFDKGRQGPWVGDVHDAILLASLLPNPENEALRFVDVASPVYDPGGEFKGVLTGHLSWSWAREVQTSLVDSVDSLADIDMLIVGADGTVLLQPDGTFAAGPEGTYPRLDIPSVQAARAGAAAVLLEEWPDGETYLTGVARSPGYLSYSGLGWMVVVRQRADAALAPARALQREIIGSGLILALLFVVVGWVLAGRIARPLQLLALATDRFRRGERGLLVEESEGEDEIAALASSLRTMMGTVTDQETDLRRLNESLEQRVRERTRELRTLAHVARETDNGVIITDAKGKIIWVNAGFTQMTGHTLDEVLGMRPDELLHGPDTDPEADRMLAEKLGAGQAVKTELLNYTRSGQTFWVDLEVQPAFGDDGSVANFVAIQRDATARREHEARLRHDALHDTLTGLPNRALLTDRLDHVVRRTEREPDTMFAVMFIDLDGFKAVNDNLGHAAGDRLLVMVARRLQSAVRGGDTVARLGGDEFAVILEQVGSEREAATVAGRIVADLGRPFTIEDDQVSVSASIGLAIDGCLSADGPTLLDRADEAMYRAKQRGKACFVIAPSDASSESEAVGAASTG